MVLITVEQGAVRPRAVSSTSIIILIILVVVVVCCCHLNTYITRSRSRSRSRSPRGCHHSYSYCKDMDIAIGESPLVSGYSSPMRFFLQPKVVCMICTFGYPSLSPVPLLLCIAYALIQEPVERGPSVDRVAECVVSVEPFSKISNYFQFSSSARERERRYNRQLENAV